MLDFTNRPTDVCENDTNNFLPLPLGLRSMVFTSAYRNITSVGCEWSTTLRYVELLSFLHNWGTRLPHCDVKLVGKALGFRSSSEVEGFVLMWPCMVYNLVNHREMWRYRTGCESSELQTDHTTEEQQVKEMINWVRRVGFHWKKFPWTN